MKEKIKMGCGLGCGTVLILFIVGFIFLKLLLYIPPTVFIENKAVGYIIEHVDEFKDEINAMGYEVRVAYTLGEMLGEDFEEDEYSNKQTKLGYEDRGILILSNEKEEYRFDVGFEYYKTYINDGATFLAMFKSNENGVLDLDSGNDVYPVHVTLNNEEIDNYWISSLWNDYNISFTEAREVGLHGVQKQADSWIKKYISAEELRTIYERCIGLQEKLVELYKAKKE